MRLQRRLEDAQRELDLTAGAPGERRARRGAPLARREAEEGLKLRVLEKDQTIASMQQKIEELKRHAEQGLAAVAG